MRFVRNTSANDVKDLNKPIRNCIASAKVSADKVIENISNKDILSRVYKKAKSIMDLSKSLFESASSVVKEKYSKLHEKFGSKILTISGTIISATLLVLVFNLNFSFGYNAFLKGVDLGYVPSKDYLKICLDSINGEFAEYVSGENIIEGNVAYVPSVVRRGKFTDAEALKENIKSTCDVMIKAYSVDVDGKAYSALADEASAKSILSQIADSYKLSESTEVSFDENVQVVYKYVPSSILLSYDQALTRLSSFTTVYDSVMANSNMTLSDFAYFNGLEKEQILALNPGVCEYVTPNDKLVIPVRKPIITVITNDTVTYDEAIPFEEKIVEDAGMYEGTKVVSQIGAQGKATVTEKISRSNGVVVGKTILSKNVIAEPVVQVLSVGTLERPAHVGSGTFMRPYYGNVSSRFGYRRSGNHTGVDFCGNTGDNIVAADSGTVSFSGWSGGYGYVVKIDHNNGYETYYAHCSKLYVKEGDVVKKGETIAALGSTGNSTGPHVHFEVRYNDEVQNPMNYVG